jgi:hypothetical protein
MNDLEKEFIPYQEAFELKELGFDEPCFGYYLCKNSAFGVELELTTNWIDLLPYDSSSCKAPTYSQAFKWFRKKGYRFSVIIDSPLAEEESHYIEIWFEKQFLHESHYIYKKYEDAELDLLKKLIQYEKEKQQ